MCSSVSCINEFGTVNFIPFSCVFTWQGKIWKDEGTEWWWSSGATETDDLYRFSCYSYCSASSKSHPPYSTTPGACSKMAVWYWVACCIWCLACIAPNLLNCISLAYTLYMWIWHAFLFLYILHLPITPCPYIKLLFLCILHLSLMMRQSRPWVSMRCATLIKSAVSSSPHDSQEAEA